jgi:hypothetical protein
MLSISDIIRSLESDGTVHSDDVVETLKAICAHPNVGTETMTLAEEFQRPHGSSTRQRARPRGGADTTKARRTRNAQGRPS